jgi:hypothetical protein
MATATKRWAKVLGGFEGFHCWPEAPNYLKNLHRHWFGVTLWLELKHDDRDVEFYDLKERLKGWIEFELAQKMESTWSCEMIADLLAECAQEDHPGRALKIEVTEDNLEGALCEYA